MSTSAGFRILKFIAANDAIKGDPPQIHGRFLVHSVLAVRVPSIPISTDTLTCCLLVKPRSY